MLTPLTRSTASLDAAYASRTEVGGLVPPPLTGVVTAALGTTPAPIDYIGSVLYGDRAGDIYQSVDDGATWTLLVAAYPGDNLRRIIQATDGEVVAFSAHGVYRSTGWGTGSLSWTQKVTMTGTSTLPPFSADGYGNKFICTQYSSDARADSRYCHVSLDGGVTWAVAYDSVVKHGATLANQSHLHGCAYDRYADRFYLAEGHDDGGSPGDIAGIYCSTDNGATWTRATGMKQNPAPTCLVSVEDGLVCASDNSDNGLYGVRRQTTASDEELRAVWRWRTGRAGLVGFGRRGFRQPGTNTVYFSFTTAFTDVAPIIAAGTVESGGLVWTWPSTPVTNSDLIDAPVVTRNGRLRSSASINGSSYSISGFIGKPSTGSVSRDDEGNVIGGAATSGDSLAVGKRSTTGAALRSVAVGITTIADETQDCTAVGYAAETTATSATAVGSGAKAGATGVAIGQAALTGTGSENTVIGTGAQITGSGGSAVAIGRSATVSGNSGVAIGRGATAAGGTFALGYGATASHTASMAFGTSAATTANNQVTFGARHIEIGEVTAPGVSAADRARLYVKDNGSGKTLLCVIFSSGAEQVIATQP